ncbi:hypothetical protein PINS_up014327 [Pythium insidiosum]|nr:hypothetical protein PINS_up014327 [Pythium insidiosum]
MVASQASLQLRCSTPKQSTSAALSSSLSRFRLLDEREQAREAEAIERIVQDLQSKRDARRHVRSPPASRTPRRSRQSSVDSVRVSSPTSVASPPPPAYEYRYNQPASNAWSDDEDDEDDDTEGEEKLLRPPEGDEAVAPEVGAFQEQVLQELRRLREAQQKDLDAIRKLQREKAEAERRAQQLEQSLRASQSRGDGPALRLDDLVASGHGDEAAAPEWMNATDNEDDDDPVIEVSHSHSRSSLSTRPRGSRSPSVAGSTAASGISGRTERRQAPRGRPLSARSAVEERSEVSPNASISRSSRPRSASREAAVRRSSDFFEAKRQAQEEQERREREAKERLARAARARPPEQFLERQEHAERRKAEKVSRLQRELDAELSPTKRVRAKEVPVTTYVATDATAERELTRKERLLQRSQELLAQSELPARMKLAQQQEAETQRVLEAAKTMRELRADVSLPVSRKLRRRLQEQAEEEEARRRATQPKPVPDFTRLQRHWERSLSAKKSLQKPTAPRVFFASRAAELETLKAKKEARKKKLEEKDAEARRLEAERQAALLAKARASAALRSGGRPTKADELRVRKVQAALRAKQQEEEREALAAEVRAMKLKEASRRIAAEVRAAEQRRKGDYAGDFVELQSVESAAKEKAREQRAQFKAAIQRNKEKILASVAQRPTLMERFSTALQREEHKRNALEAVVKNVFQKNLPAMKGILNDDEQELARDLIAADVAADDGDGDDSDSQKKKTKKKKSPKREDEEDADEETYEDDAE